MPQIDVHHHFFPPTLDKRALNANVGWRTPAENLPWTPEVSLGAMDALGIDIAVLSFPAIGSGTVGERNRNDTRDKNNFVVNICERYPERFGFFATVPFLDDVNGVLNEIAFALDELKADGISLSSSYGEGSLATYIGDDRYDPIWAELDRRGTVVFVHGTQTPSSTPYPHELLGLPISEVPNETYKAAAHLVVSGRKRKYPNVKIILAHLGGSTPFLAARVAVLSRHMGCTLTEEEILEDFKSFYFDTALSGYEANLMLADVFVKPGKLLFGTDIPAVSKDMARWYAENTTTFYGKDSPKLAEVMYENALELFPRFKQWRAFRKGD